MLHRIRLAMHQQLRSRSGFGRKADPNRLGACTIRRRPAVLAGDAFGPTAIPDRKREGGGKAFRYNNRRGTDDYGRFKMVLTQLAGIRPHDHTMISTGLVIEGTLKITLGRHHCQSNRSACALHCENHKKKRMDEHYAPL